MEFYRGVSSMLWTKIVIWLKLAVVAIAVILLDKLAPD